VTPRSISLSVPKITPKKNINSSESSMVNYTLPAAIIRSIGYIRAINLTFTQHIP